MNTLINLSNNSQKANLAEVGKRIVDRISI